MALYKINPNDPRLKNISRNAYDCFMFDLFTIKEFDRILDGKSVILDRFIKDKPSGDEDYHVDKHIMGKVRTLKNLTKNNIFSTTFLVFQTVSWKSSKEKMPFILIPVRLYDGGTKLVRNGQIIVNPHIYDQLDVPITNRKQYIKDVKEVDTKEFASLVEDNNGRIIYEMYLTHFMIEYNDISDKGLKRYSRSFSSDHVTKDRNTLFTLDREGESIRMELLKGLNVIVESSKGTDKNKLISNVMYDYLLKGKKVGWVSEQDNPALKQVLKATTLNKHIEDLNYPKYSDEVQDFSAPKFNYSKFEIIEKGLELYQSEMRKPVKEFRFNDLIREAILLEQFDDPFVQIELLDSLSFQDIQSIRRILRKIESTIKTLGEINPSESILNDLEIREVRGKEQAFGKQVENLYQAASLIERTVSELNNRFSLNIKSELTDLENRLGNLDHFNFYQYPEQWFEQSIFSEAQDKIRLLSDLVRRVSSLYNTLSDSYTPSFMESDLVPIIDSVYTELFTEDQVDEINLFLNAKGETLNHLQTIKKLSRDWVESEKQILDFYDFYKGKDLYQFTLDMELLLLTNKDAKNWYDLSEKDILTAISIIEQDDEVIKLYAALLKSVEYFFEKEVLSVDQILLNQYVDLILVQKGYKFSPEFTYSKQFIEQFQKPSFVNLTKKEKQEIVSDVIELIKINEKAKGSLSQLKDILGKEFSLDQIDEILNILNALLHARPNAYLRSLTAQQKIKLQQVTSSYKLNIQKVKEFLEHEKFSMIFSYKLDVFKDQFKQLEAFLTHLYDVRGTFLAGYKVKPKKITLSMMKQVSFAIHSYQVSKTELDSYEDVFRKLYGVHYMSQNTNINKLFSLIGEFRTLVSYFKSHDALSKTFETKSLKIIHGSLQDLLKQTDLLDRTMQNINRYFYREIEETKINQLMNYLYPFKDYVQIQHWVRLMDYFQTLRNYYQLKFVSLMNTGYLKEDFLAYFDRALAKSLLDTYYEYENHSDDIENIQFYADLVEAKTNYKVFEFSKERKKKRITMGNVASYEALDSKEFNLMIIDGAEKIHQNFLKNASLYSEQIMVIYDAKESISSITIPHYLERFAKYRMTSVMQQPLHNLNKVEKGIYLFQDIVVVQNIELLDIVKSQLVDTNYYVNLIVNDEQKRNDLFEEINEILYQVSTSQTNYVQMMDRIQVLLPTEHHARSTVTIIYDPYVLKEEVYYKILENTESLIVIDQKKIFKDTMIYQKMTRPIDTYLPDVTKPILKWFVSELNIPNLLVKETLAPFDLAIIEDDMIQTLIKINFSDKENSDILEDAIMMYHSGYDRIQKIIISVDDLYYKKEEILEEVRQRIQSGKGE